MLIDRSTPLTDLPGVGAARGKALMRLGLFRAVDLLRYFPRDYEDRRTICPIAQAPADQAVCVEAMVSDPARWTVVRRGLDLVKLKACDDTGIINITFFNQPYTKNALHVGENYFFYGKVEHWGSQFQMNNPVFEPVDRTRFTGRIMPVYALTAGVSNNLLAGLVQRALDAGGAAWEKDALPRSLRRTYGLVPLEEALSQIHFPEDTQKLELARRRLIFEELFTLSAGLSLLRSRRAQALGPDLSPANRGEFLGLLPFPPTGAQLRVMGELEGDTQPIDGDVEYVTEQADWENTESELEGLMPETGLTEQEEKPSESEGTEPDESVEESEAMLMEIEGDIAPIDEPEE